MSRDALPVEPDVTAADSPSPADSPSAPAGPTLSFSFNLAKIEGKGEDSDPIVRDGRELGLVAVFDGMGGAGGTSYATSDGPRTGAYIASRVARDAVEQRMLQLLDPEWNLDGPATARDLQQGLKEVLANRLSELNAPRSALRSRLIRALPSTMAMIALQRQEQAGVRWACHLFWAGDSRAYLFQPDAGAHQLTVDDIRDRGDAMANLRGDSVVSNALSADTEFVIHHHERDVTAPFLAVAATDGCFGYVPTPMHFEYLVLRALREASDVDHWSTAVQASISTTSGDDAAMAVLGVGADFRGFQELFARRTTELEERWIEPLDDLEAELTQAQRRVDELRLRQKREQAQLWAQYKPAYERYLESAKKDQS